MAFTIHNQNFGLLMSLAEWRNEEWQNDNIKKAKKIQKAINNIIIAKEIYAKRL